MPWRIPASTPDGIAGIDDEQPGLTQPRAGRLTPLLLGVVEQRVDPGLLDLPDRIPHRLRRRGPGPVVVAALQRVLELQGQLRADSA